MSERCSRQSDRRRCTCVEAAYCERELPARFTANRAETERARSTAMAAGPDSGCREGKTAGLRDRVELLPQIQHERAETLCVQ